MFIIYCLTSLGEGSLPHWHVCTKTNQRWLDIKDILLELCVFRGEVITVNEGKIILLFSVI